MIGRITAVDIVGLTFMIAAFLPLTSFAKEQTEFDLEKVLEGFAQPVVRPSILNKNQENNSSPEQCSQVYPAVNLSGTISQAISYAPFNHTTAAGNNVHGLTSFKPWLALVMDAKLNKDWSAKISGWAFYDFSYTIQGRNNYSSEMLNSYEHEVELGESFIRGRLTNHLDITFGRQVAVWGKADFFRVADILNPIDNRERGLDNLEFRRLPVLLTKLDTFAGDWHTSGIITHEIRHNKDPVYGSDWYPYDFPAPSREDVSNNLGNSSLGLSAGRSYPGYDIAFYLGYYLKELDIVGLSPETPERLNSRLFMIAAAAEKAQGHWLFKIETAYVDGLEYYAIPDESMSRFDLLLGTDYTGFVNTRFSLEIVNRYLFNLDSNIAKQDNTPDRDEFVWAFRVARSYLRDKVELSLLSYVGGLDFTQGSAQNLSLKYEINDQTTFSTGFIFVQSGDNYFMENVGKNDKVFLKLKYIF